VSGTDNSDNRESLGRLTLRDRERLEIQRKIYKLYISGVKRQNDIAARVGVCQATVSKYLQEIFKEFRENLGQSLEDERNVRIRELDEDRMKALDGYERSKKNAEKITITYGKKTCPDCEDGMLEDGSWCTTCGGEGELQTETQIREIKGQVGDIQHLRHASWCSAEAARISGLHRHDLDKQKKEGTVEQHLHFHQHDAKINLEGATEDQLLNLLAAMEALKGEGSTKVVEAENEG